MFKRQDLAIGLLIVTLILVACGQAAPTADTAAVEVAQASVATAEAKAAAAESLAATAQAQAANVADASAEELAGAKATAEAAMKEAEAAKAEAEAAQAVQVEPVANSSIGVVVAELGRDYLAYPDTAGTITFSNCWGGSRVPLIEMWIAEFNKVYPNIEVINDSKDCPKILDSQITQIAGGAPPDVLMMQSANFPQFAKEEAILPLNELMERDKIDPTWFYEAELAARMVDGQVYGLPNVTGGAQHLIFWKTDVLEQLGVDLETIATWQDLEAIAKAGQDQDIFAMDPAKMPHGQTVFTALLYANGGQLWSDDLTEITWDSPEGIEAAEWLHNFINLQVDSYDNLAAAGDRRNVLQAPTFAAGPYVASFNGSWLFFQLANEAPDVQYNVANFPANANNPDSTGDTFVEGGWAFAIANGISPENQAAAWEWIKFTTLSKFACEFTIAQARPSPVKACNEDPRLAEENPHWDVVKASLDSAVVVPVTDIHSQFQELLYEMEDAIIYDQMTPAEAVESYAARAQALLDEWNASKP